MKENKYLSDSQFRDILEAMSSEMTDGAAIGYMIMAAQALKLEHGTIKRMEAMMREMMDFYATVEAENVYQAFI